MADSSFQIIALTPENITEYGVCGYKDVKKHLELRRKIDWFCKYYPLGLRIKALITETGEYQGMLEYIPGEYAHRPVNDHISAQQSRCAFGTFCIVSNGRVISHHPISNTRFVNIVKAVKGEV